MGVTGRYSLTYLHGAPPGPAQLSIPVSTPASSRHLVKALSLKSLPSWDGGRKKGREEVSLACPLSTKCIRDALTLSTTTPGSWSSQVRLKEGHSLEVGSGSQALNPKVPGLSLAQLVSHCSLSYPRSHELRGRRDWGHEKTPPTISVQGQQPSRASDSW